MSASQLKGILGALMGLAGVIIPFIPSQYQWIPTLLIGVFGGGHAITAATTTDPPKK